MPLKALISSNNKEKLILLKQYRVNSFRTIILFCHFEIFSVSSQSQTISTFPLSTFMLYSTLFSVIVGLHDKRAASVAWESKILPCCHPFYAIVSQITVSSLTVDWHATYTANFHCDTLEYLALWQGHS